MGENLARGLLPAEAVIDAAAATDGVVAGYTPTAGFAYFNWPGTFTLDLGSAAPLSVIRFLLWDGDSRLYKYRVLVSSDYETWTVLFDTGKDSYVGWQSFTLDPPVSAQYVRIHGLSNTANSDFHIVELEVYSGEPEPLDPAVPGHVITLRARATEVGDGLPIAHTLDALVASLQKLPATNSLFDKSEVNRLIAMIRLQVHDAEALQSNITSIRRQIVDPVDAELKKGGKISRVSLGVGIIGGVATLVSLALYVFDFVSRK